MIPHKHILLSLLIPSLITSSLAQAGQDQSSDSKEPKLTRTLRIILAGSRPLPVFEKQGEKYVEVTPPLSQLPPTAFAFTDPSHAPHPKANAPREAEFSAWANELTQINRYKGPAKLQLTLKRPLVEPSGTSTPLHCDLGKTLHPLVIIHPDSGSAGWDKPQTQVLDMSPAKRPARSVIVVNLSELPIKIYLTKKGVFIPPSKSAILKTPSSGKESFRYRIDASNGKKLVTVSNSSYRINDNSRIIILALPGHKTKNAPFALPKLQIISDSI